jgi:hypothetical protein
MMQAPTVERAGGPSDGYGLSAKSLISIGHVRMTGSTHFASASQLHIAVQGDRGGPRFTYFEDRRYGLAQWDHSR